MNKKLGIKKLIEGTELTIEAWELLGLDKQAPREYNELKFKLSVLKNKEKEYA